MRTIQITICLLLVFAVISFAQFELADKNEKNKCLKCHQSSFSTKNNHFIDNSDDCQFCHEVSSQKANHETETFASNTLCQSCHFDIDEGTRLLKHDSFNCVNCHSPHGSDHEYSLKKNTVSLCTGSCHTNSQLGSSHPVGEGVVDKHVGGEMTCVSTCHANHKPTDEKMLQLASNDLCGQCHMENY